MANTDLAKLLKKVAEVTSSTVKHSESKHKVSFAEDKFHRKNDDSTRDASGSSRPSKNKKKMGLTQTDDHLITNEDDRKTLSKLTSDQDHIGKKSNEKRKMQTRGTNPNPEREAALAELAKRRQDSANKKALTTCSNEKALALATSSNTSRDASNHEKALTTTTFYSGYTDNIMVGFESETFATFDEIKEIIVTREKLMEWYKEPFFDKLIAGCFVRLGIGKSSRGVHIYRLCLVRNADDTDPYKSYKFEKEDTYMYLNLVWGNEYASARWQMSCVSDAPLTKKEFNEWAHEVKRHMGYWPTKRDVIEKKEAIRATSSTLAITGPQIASGMEMVIFERNKSAVEARRARGGREMDEKAIKLAALNKKNKMENFKNGSRKKAMDENLKDPFSRRWTRPGNCYYGNASSDDNATRGKDADVAGRPVDENDARVVEDEEDIDLKALHDFDLPISLDNLERFGGARGARVGYLANKQRVEGALGVKVPEDDGTVHRKTLTVDDYMRRRGLL